MLTDTSLERLRLVHPELMRRIVRLDVMVPSLSIQVTQGLRTVVEQDALYAQGRTEPGSIVTNAKGGYSGHQFGYCVDLVPEDIIAGQPDWDLTHPAWQKLLAVAPQCKLAEGAKWRTFPDNPHFFLFELPPTPTDEMRAAVSLSALWATWTGVVEVTA